MSAAAVVEAPAMYVGCVGVGSDGWYGGERAWATCGVYIGGGGEGATHLMFGVASTTFLVCCYPAALVATWIRRCRKC